MPVQTTYAAERPAAYEGQVADLGLQNIFSKVAEGTSIPFGRAVVRGTADGQCKLPSGGTAGLASSLDTFLGISVITSTWTTQLDGSRVYEVEQDVNILDHGYAWVYTEESVVPGDPVFFRHIAAASPNDELGRFRKSDNSMTCTRVIGAVFASTASAGTLALVKLNGDLSTEKISALTVASTISPESDIVRILAATTYTALLAAGFQGQRKTLTRVATGAEVVTVTPTALAGATSLVFSAQGDTAELISDQGTWYITSLNGATTV